MLRSRLTTIEPFVWDGPYARWRAAMPHDPGLCADVRAPWMAPGERLIVRSCEIIGDPQGYWYDDHNPPHDPDGRGRQYRHIPFTWERAGAPQMLRAACRVPGRGMFALTLQACEDGLDLQLTVRNDRDVPVGPIDWAFCVVALESPQLRDPEHERTSVLVGDRLQSFRELNGQAGITLIPIAGGEDFVPVHHRHVERCSRCAEAPLVVVESGDGRHTAALAFDRAYSSYGSTGNMCFHADPHFGTLAPGQEKQMRGKLYLIEGGGAEVIERYQRDFAVRELMFER